MEPAQIVGNGVIYKGNLYHFKTKGLTTTNSALTPGRNNRLFWLRCQIYVRLAAADTTTFVGCDSSQYGSALPGPYVTTVPSAAGAYNLQSEMGVLLDPGVSIEMTWDNAPSDAYILVVYAEVDDTA